MNQPTARHYQLAADALACGASLPYVVGAVLGGRFEPEKLNRFGLAVWRMFIGTEYAEQLNPDT